MRSIYRCSRYGFVEITGICEADRTDIELAALCVSGVYGAAMIVRDKKLHVIFNPEVTDLNEISQTIALIGYQTSLHEISKKAVSFSLYRLKTLVYYVNSSVFLESLISGLNK